MSTNKQKSEAEFRGFTGLSKGEIEIDPALKEIQRQFAEHSNSPEQKAILEKRISSLRETANEIFTFKPFKHNKK